MRRTSIDALRFLSSALAGRPTPCLARGTRLTTRSAGRRSSNVVRTRAYTTLPPHYQQAQPQQSNQSPSSPPKPTITLPQDIDSLSKLTHYDLFPSTLPSGPPPSGPFAIDTRTLRREFLSLQALAHPDRHPHDAKGQAYAQTLSARINEAYKTLSDPLARAQYLLGLREADAQLAEGAQLGEGEGDQELLMTVLELREQIEEAETEEEVDAMKGENEERVKESVRVLEEAFSRDELVLAAREVVRLRYWVNVQDTLGAWEKGKPVVLAH